MRWDYELLKLMTRQNLSHKVKGYSAAIDMFSCLMWQLQMVNVITEVKFDIVLRRDYNSQQVDNSPRPRYKVIIVHAKVPLSHRPLPTQTLEVDRCARGSFQGSFAERLG